MAGKSKIEWTDKTLNPVVGCTRVSEGCRNCYAERLAARFSSSPNAANYEGIAEFTEAGPRWTNQIRLIPALLERPFQWKKPARIFVNSMSDLFHEDVPFEFIQSVFEMMNGADWHQYQVLTKRASRLAHLAPHLPWSENIWMGVSVEDRDTLPRADYLRQTDAHIKWLSVEPLIGDLGYFDTSGIDWVVVGGESGANARPMEKEWVYSIRDRCQLTNTPFFFKQWGGFRAKSNGRELDGKTYDEYPA